MFGGHQFQLPPFTNLKVFESMLARISIFICVSTSRYLISRYIFCLIRSKTKHHFKLAKIQIIVRYHSLKSSLLEEAQVRALYLPQKIKLTLDDKFKVIRIGLPCFQNGNL